MASPFLAEIRIVGFNFAPNGWALCNGQLIPISQNTALFSLLGTFYGGDGKSTFALPNFQGRAPMHQGQGQGLSDRVIGEQSGSQFVTLLTSEIPFHSHFAQCSNTAGSVPTPVNNTWGSIPGRTPPLVYAAGSSNTQMGFQALGIAGSSQPHNNMQSYLTLNFVIAMQGVFPARP
jgi:microcystin-dependent protein